MTEKKLIKDQLVVLDYADHRNTRFERCKMIYRGGRPPTLIGNDFPECEWIFENEAENTVRFLRALISGGGQELILNTLGLKDNA